MAAISLVLKASLDEGVAPEAVLSSQLNDLDAGRSQELMDEMRGAGLPTES